MKKIIAGAILTASLAVLPHSADAASGPLRPCKYEGMNGCFWDAKHMGNGVGKSYRATKKGRVIYISHKRAHQYLIAWRNR